MALGQMAVDYEMRVDFPRLRDYRIGRARAALDSSECGAFLLFDFYNIRYTTQTWVGGALGDKMTRYALLTRGGDPMLWDFGSAVRHHKLYSPWLKEEDNRPGMLGMRGAIAPSAGLMESAVREIKGLLEDAGVAGLPVGIDIVEPAFLFEMQRQGLTVVDCQQLMLDARQIKSPDEIMLLNQAAAMVDGVYQDIVEALKPGVRESHQVRRRDHAVDPGGRDGRRRLPGHLRGPEARRPRERDRRARQPAALCHGVGPGRGGERDLRGTVQPPPPQLHRPADPSG